MQLSRPPGTKQARPGRRFLGTDPWITAPGPPGESCGEIRRPDFSTAEPRVFHRFAENAPFRPRGGITFPGFENRLLTSARIGIHREKFPKSSD